MSRDATQQGRARREWHPQVRGYVGGTFDLFHAGHVAFFRQCRERCDKLIVSLNTDEFSGRYKRPPILTLAERTAVVSACRWVDEVVVNVGCEDSKVAIVAARANVVFHGDDWTGPSLMKQMQLTDEFLTTHGVRLEYVPYTPGISTSDIMRRVLAAAERDRRPAIELVQGEEAA